MQSGAGGLAGAEGAVRLVLKGAAEQIDQRVRAVEDLPEQRGFVELRERGLIEEVESVGRAGARGWRRHRDAALGAGDAVGVGTR